MKEEISDEMTRLSGALVAEHGRLDHTIASLPKLDAIAGEALLEPAALRAIGAYLGEVMRRAAPDALTWADDGGTPVLVTGSARWHPIEKVEKRRRNGTRDDLTSFAGVVLAMTPGAGAIIDDAAKSARREAASVNVVQALGAFRAIPAAEQFLQFGRLLFGLAPSHVAALLRSLDLRTEEILPLLAAPAFGRGYERRDPGRLAARMLTSMVAFGAADREAVDASMRPSLKDRNKTVRANVAEVLATIDLCAGSARVALELGSSEDRAIVGGVVCAIRRVAVDVRREESEPPVPLSTLTPVLLPALRPGSADLMMALDAVNDWSFPTALAAEAQCVGDALDQTAKSGKPQAARFARDIRSRTRNARPRPRGEPSARWSPRSVASLEAVNGGASLAMALPRLSILRELLREIGAAAEQGQTRAMQDGPPVDAAAVPIDKLLATSLGVVTPTECRVIAERLRAHVELACEVATLFDDAPSGHELRAWLAALGDFHEQAADRGGYRFA